GGRQGDRDRVEEGLAHRQLRVARLEHLQVVVEGEAPVLEDRPPPGRRDLVRRPEGGEEQPEGRGGPEDRDDQRGDRRRAAGEPALGALDRGGGGRLSTTQLTLGGLVQRDVDGGDGAHRISLCFLICLAL